MTCKDCVHNKACNQWVAKEMKYLESVDGFICDYFQYKLEWVHMPCKVGDTLYKICPQGSAVKMGAMWNGKIVTQPCQRCPWQNCQCFDIGYQKDMENIIQPIKIKSRRFIFDIEPYIGKIWFTDKESAEKALEERKT